MKYCLHNDNGQIISTGVCPSDMTAKNFEHLDGTLILDIAAEIDSSTHYVDNGEFIAFPPKPSAYHTWEWTAKAWQPDTELASQAARAKRDAALAACDWTQLPDVPIATKEKWATYRQELRDITNQSGFPFVIDWPVCP